MGIVTDSRAPGEHKSTEGSALFQLYQAFSSAEETAAFAQQYQEGIAWGDAKTQLFERVDQEIAPKRAVYEELIQNPAAIERTLKMGAEKARAVATPFTSLLRQAVGIRSLEQQVSATPQRQGEKPAALPTFKQYRENDGRFHFKMLDTKGQLLLQSEGFASPKDAGQAIASLRRDGPRALASLQKQLSFQADEAPLVAALKELQAASD